MALSSSSSPSGAVSKRQSQPMGCAPRKQLNNIEVLSLMRQQREHPSPLKEWSPVHPGIQLRVNLLNKLLSDLECSHVRLQQEAQKTQQASQIVQDFAAWPSIAPEYAAIKAANPWLAKQAAKYARPVIEKEYTQAIAFLQARQRREQLPEGEKLKRITSGEERTTSPLSSPEEHRELRKKASSQDLRASLITHQGSPARRRPRTPPEKEGNGRPKTPERPTPNVARRLKNTPSPRQRPPVNEIKKLRLTPHGPSKPSPSQAGSTPSGLSPSPMIPNQLSKPNASPLACVESMGIVLTPEQRLEFSQRAEQLEAMAYLELRWHRLHYAMTEIQGFCVRGLAERESERIAKMMYPIRRRRPTAGGNGVSALRGLLAGLDEDDDVTLFGSDDDSADDFDDDDDDDDEFENELDDYEKEWENELEDSDLDDECDLGENDDSDEDDFSGSAVEYNRKYGGGRGVVNTSNTPTLFARAGAQSRLSMSEDNEQQQHQQQQLPLDPHRPTTTLPDTPPVISSVQRNTALPQRIKPEPEGQPIDLTPPATPKPAPRKINLNPRNVTLPPSTNPRTSSLNLNLGLAGAGAGGNLKNKPNHAALAKEIDTLLPCEKENLTSTPLKTLNINRSTNARPLGEKKKKKMGLGIDLGIESRPVLGNLGAVKEVKEVVVVKEVKEVDALGGKEEEEAAAKENQPPAGVIGSGGAGGQGGGGGGGASGGGSRPGLLKPGLGRRFSYHAGGGRILG